MKTVSFISLGLAVLVAWLMSGSHVVEVRNERVQKPVVVRSVESGTSVGEREVSSYTLGRVEETDATPCHGAWGDDLCAIVRAGTRVCASNEFKKGTKLVVGDGLECVVLDRMNRRYATRVDVADLDYEAARRFGVQVLEVAIIR